MRCQEKKHYLTRAAAEAAATRTTGVEKYGAKLFAYQCDLCRLWHLTRWTPQKQAYALQSRAQSRAAIQTTQPAKQEPPSTKALRAKLVQITAALKLAERREDAARLKRALAMGKMVEADEAMRQAENDYRAAQEAVLRLLGLSQ